MNLRQPGLRCLKWLAAAAALVVVSAVGVGCLLQAGLFRAAVIHVLERSTGRAIEVQDDLRITVFSAHPSIAARHLRVGNPPWVKPGTTADVGRLVVEFSWPGGRHGGGIERVELNDASLHLVRDSSGHANWQWTDPDTDDRRELPIIRSLLLPEAHVDLDDERRHLTFDGKLRARDVVHATTPATFEISAAGVLNGREAVLTLVADSLDTAGHRTPYRFRFTLRSSGSSLTGQGSLPHPFDFRQVDATFDAAGKDLKDLYFLAGVSLINTGPYRLSGRMTLRGTQTSFPSLGVRFGDSDVTGRLSIDSSGDRPTFDADMNSGRFKLADVGLRAAGREPPGDGSPPLLLSNTAFNPASLRKMDGEIRVKVRRLDVGRVPLSSVSATASLHQAILTVPKATADILGGKADGHLRLDAGHDLPRSRLTLAFNDVHPESLFRDPDDPPIEGAWAARVDLTGEGRSLHQAASNASGVLSAVMPGGSIRESLAELTGLDLRGLGLLLGKSRSTAPVRCAVLEFNASNGLLTAQRLVLDTDQVLITGQGTVRLTDEQFDLQVRGSPKHLRLFRIKAPLAVKGSLSHPTVSILGGRATLAIVDPGRGADTGCPAAPSPP